MAISAKDVMALRQRTGMGMMECKAALGEADGDMDAAVEILRKAAKGKMDERSDREAAEGVIAVAASDTSAAIVELNSETDFVAKNEQFIAVADSIAAHLLGSKDGVVAADDTITKAIDEVRVTTKENVSYKRGIRFSGERIGTYVHHNRKVGAVVVVEGGDVDADTLVGLAQHVAAADGVALPRPLAPDADALPADQVEAKQKEFVAEAEATGKPAEIAEKIAAGKMQKWIAENTLLGQPYVRDMTGKTSVGQLLKGARVRSFERFHVGG